MLEVSQKSMHFREAVLCQGSLVGLQLISKKKCFFPFINAEIVTKFLTLAGSTIFDAFAVFQFYVPFEWQKLIRVVVMANYELTF